MATVEAQAAAASAVAHAELQALLAQVQAPNAGFMQIDEHEELSVPLQEIAELATRPFKSQKQHGGGASAGAGRPATGQPHSHQASAGIPLLLVFQQRRPQNVHDLCA